MATPGDITYPEHGLIGLGKYVNAAAQRSPDFQGINRMFAGLGQTPLVRGGQFIDPSQAQQYATAPYLQARGQIAQQDIGNLFNLANLAMLTGQSRGSMAALIPELQAQQVQLGSTGLFGGLL